MAQTINALTAPDSYTPASTMTGANFQRIILDVANQAIYWQIQDTLLGGFGTWQENAETYMLPGSRVILEPTQGFRFRAAIPSTNIPAGTSQAVVTARAIT